MKKTSLTIAVLVLTCISARAQWRDPAGRIEAGALLGVAGYSGDLSTRRVDLSELQPAGGVFLRYHLRGNFSVRGHVYTGVLSGDDKHSPIRAARSFSFGTSFVELSGGVEWYPFRERIESGSGWLPFPFSPYLYAGAAVVFLDVGARYYGRPERADDFITTPLPEGGPFSVLAAPALGGGIRLAAYGQFIFGLEGGLRPVFSDYLDGVSRNGNPGIDDWYFFLGATATFAFPR